MRNKALVQNYYELHGSFKGIELESYYGDLKGKMQDYCLKPEDYLYLLLGYLPIYIGDKPEEKEAFNEILKKREYEKIVAYSSNLLMPADVVALHDAYYGLGEKPTGVTEEMMQDLCKQSKCLSVFRDFTNKEHLLEYQKLQLLVNYYKDCCNLTTEYKGRVLTLPQLFIYLKKSKESFTREYATGVFSPFYVKCQKASTCYITDNILFTVDGALSETTQQLALMFAYLGYVLPIMTKIDVSYDELIFFGLSFNKRYVQLLDLARVNGITYADLMMQLKYKVPDQALVFKQTENVLVRTGDIISLVKDDANLRCKKPLVFTEYSDFVKDLPVSLSNVLGTMGVF